MTDVDALLKSTVEELDKLLNPKNVLGDPIERDGATVIPIVSYGFGFGAGGGEGAGDAGKGQAQGKGGGAGAGGGIKPLGAIIIDQNGARVEAVKGAMTSVATVLAETAGRAMGRNAAKEDDA
ncbi:hypothetical protein KUV65_04970 [Maritalea mobilis]|uniref:spore germination protein GerW family protein n=1 Tax=Maritalea mobilis TaxID=483324 RepID=UPI001C964B7D|nr:spore germination protein GerW family protein [Maritalea mobilis]MBY6200703.1 hypothetical protein [Maritalea mobilis]